MSRILRALARQCANQCLLPRLRHWLFRRSGLAIGDKAFVNMGLTVVDRYEGGFVTIGARVSMAPNITLVTHSDPNESVLKEQGDLIKIAPITIADDSWIGAQVTILPGVTIGPRSIVGAGSVVTQDVPPDCIYGGVPARLIRTLDPGDEP